MNIGNVLWLATVALIGVAACAVGDTVFKSDFEIDPLKSGWVMTGPVSAANWEDTLGAHGGRCLYTNEGAWESPMIPVTPFTFYKTTFQAKVTPRTMPKTSEPPKVGHPASPEDFPAYWSVFYYDANGKQLDSDHYWGLELSDRWTKRDYVTYARAGAATMKVRFQTIEGTGVRVDDLAVTTTDAAGAAAWIDSLCATMPPFKLTAAKDRRQYIPKTMATLRNGGTLRVVMIGDSISNDTLNSSWFTLVERMYSKANIVLIPGVRGGTPIGWFAQPENVKERIIDNKPDLLVIGSLNHGKDPEAVRSIIKQTRAATSAEIVLLTPAVGNTDVTVDKEWEAPLDPNGKRQSDALYKVALEEKVEFIDMMHPWGSYISASGKPYRWFLRDFVHANERGAMILGKTIEAYFGG